MGDRGTRRQKKKNPINSRAIISDRAGSLKGSNQWPPSVLDRFGSSSSDFFAVNLSRMACCCPAADTAESLTDKVVSTVPAEPAGEGLEAAAIAEVLEAREVAEVAEVEAVVEAPSVLSFKVVKSSRLGFSVDTLIKEQCIVRTVLADTLCPGLQPWDRLIRVNGEAGSAKELGRRADEGVELELTFQRPKVSQVRLEKNGQNAGLDVDMGLRTLGLFLVGLSQGASQQLPEGSLKPLDRICAVDGVETSAAELAQKIAESDAPLLTVRRYESL